MNELIEKLAAIEHERWADWQQHMHSQMTYCASDDTMKIPAEYINRWDRQISTLYAELSETEKEKDREQVLRYWPLIEALQAQIEYLKEAHDACYGILTNWRKWREEHGYRK